MHTIVINAFNLQPYFRNCEMKLTNAPTLSAVICVSALKPKVFIGVAEPPPDHCSWMFVRVP